MNKVFIVGLLSQNPRGGDSKSGTKYASASLLVTKSYQYKGEARESKSYFTVKAFGKHAEVLLGLTTGAKIGIEGELATDSYEKDGNKVYQVIIQVRDIFMVDAPGSAFSSAPVVTPEPEADQDDLPW